MHILLFILITALFIEQLGQNFLYEKYDILMFFTPVYYIVGTCAILLAFLIIYKSIKNKEFKPQKWDICFLLLLVWGLLSVLFADDKMLAVAGSHRIDGYFSYMIYASIYVGVRTIKSENAKMWLIRVFAITASLLCLDTIFAKSITSIFFNQNHFGYLLTLSSMLVCGLFIYEKKILLKIVFVTMFLINTYTLIKVDTFGSYLAVLIGLIFTIILIALIKTDLKKLLLSVAMFVLFLLLSLTINLKTDLLNNNFNKLGSDIEKIATNAPDVENAGSLRIKLWKHSFKYIKERPIFGYGPEGTYYSFYEDDMGYDRPHNEYIQCALFMGIPAAIFYIAGLIILFIHCMKNRKQLPSCAIISGIAVFAYCISAFFGNSMFYTTPFFFMLLSMLSITPALPRE